MINSFDEQGVGALARAREHETVERHGRRVPSHMIRKLAGIEAQSKKISIAIGRL
jgi:hypothetical protein